MKNKKIYTIETFEEDGKNIMYRTNDGFTGFELLGIIEFTRDELLRQMRGEIQPDIVKRTLIQD